MNHTSELLTDIIPKIKIPISYHKTGNIDLIPAVFLDDNLQDQEKQQIFSREYSDIFNSQDDLYHEVVIAGDANIVWDACRDAV